MLLNFIKGHDIFTRNECDSAPCLTGATSTPDPMDIAVLLHRDIIVDNEGQVINVKAAGCYISGYEQVKLALFKLL